MTTICVQQGLEHREGGTGGDNKRGLPVPDWRDTDSKRMSTLLTVERRFATLNRPHGHPFKVATEP